MKSASRGFTLVEVLTTLVIVSFGAILIHQAFGRSIQATRHSEETLLASHLTLEPMAPLLLESWHSGTNPALSASGKPFENYPGFSRDAKESPAAVADLTLRGCELEISTPSGKKYPSFWLLPDREVSS